MSSKIKMFGFALISVMIFNAVSYGQIASFSSIRNVGDSVQILDLTISLHRSWDEIASDSLLRNQYEQTIRYWADGTYEMTNGGHKLGNIRIFTGSRFTNAVDVQWIENGWPNAHIYGFMSPNASLRILMSDFFSGYNVPTGMDWDWRGAGYTLAHEGGHYIYGLYDEYSLETGDVPVVPSIMNSQWNARNGNYAWLNFSTSYNIGDITKTRQGRVHGVDAWTFLSSDKGRYDVLKNLSPSVSNTYTFNNTTTYPWMRVELPSNSARDSLKIIWMGNNLDIDLILDKSGSMYGEPLTNMKNAAKAFVDAINVFGKNFGITPSIGITAFCTKPENTYPITILNDNNVNRIKSIIDAISDEGMTAMYDACLFSLNKLKSHSTVNSARLAILFTDGEENYSSEKNVSNVINEFTENNIPIYTIGYGSGASHNNCMELSNGTKGIFIADLKGSADSVSKILLAMFDNAADLQYIKDATFSSNAGLDFIIDPTVYSGVAEVRYTLLDANSYCDFTITDGNGNQVPSTTTIIPLSSLYPREQIALISISSSAVAGANPGKWKCHVSSSAGLVSANLKGKVRVEGKSGGTYSASVESHQNSFYIWPQPLRLSASTTGKQGLIANLNLTAALTTPSGNVISVVLNDNGVNGDKIAHDGIYSLDYSDYTENGQYTLSVQFDNDSVNAYYAIGGVSYALPESGVMVPVDTVFVTDNFDRTESVVFHVKGVNAQAPTRTGSIMGFEKDSLWSIIHSSGTLSSNATTKTEGSASLQISGNGWQQIRSSAINTDELQNVTNTLSVDLFMGNTQTNPYWTGQVQLYVFCPSANVHNQYIGSIDLTGLLLDKFSTLSFALPQSIVDILNGSYSDFSFSLSINTNANTGAYYFDNMRFER
ncbi:MAG: VWA domain-containing protein [Chitinispirillales bacterium]|jgi:uncharacterized protein YegL|nr:VWA domain-containing protein [Chitinispirillales bacterium]